MKAVRHSFLSAALVWLALVATGTAQPRPYIGFIYPAGGQTNTTFRVHVGGQRLDGLAGAHITGKGVTARLVEYCRFLGNQDTRILREQINELRSFTRPQKKKGGGKQRAPSDEEIEGAKGLLKRIQDRLSATVNQPACGAIAHVAVLEVAIDRRAALGERELRLVTLNAESNPMAFHVGGLPEVSRPPLGTCEIQVLGKEERALRRRPPEETVTRIQLPCTVNGQISPGEVDRYRFAARKGQKVVLTTQARQLVPYIADAVPGWFQPILEIHDSEGREVAYADDFRFKPDPVIVFEVPRDGEYVFAIRDGIYRGREDFVYRISVGELPFVTGVSPRGWQFGRDPTLKVEGVNLRGVNLKLPSRGQGAGVHVIDRAVDGRAINPIPVAVDRLPDFHSREPNDSMKEAEKLKPPLIVNGVIDRPGDSDWFEFSGRAAQFVVLEVMARRLDSPLDSMLRLYDASGKALAFNDDHEEPGNGGLNTHHADSYIRAMLPRDGRYFIQVQDTTQDGGSSHGYRLRVSAPQPEFELRVAPSSISLRNRGSAQVKVHAFRKDGFDNPITVSLPELPRGLSASPAILVATQAFATVTLKADWRNLNQPVSATPTVLGSARVSGRIPIRRVAVPAEDRMQAFLWRYLVPADDFRVHIYNPSYKPPKNRVARIGQSEAARILTEARMKRGVKSPTLSKGQARSRVLQLDRLFEAGLLTDIFYFRKVAEIRAEKAR